MQLKTPTGAQGYTQNPSNTYESATSQTGVWQPGKWNMVVMRMDTNAATTVTVNTNRAATVVQNGGVKSNTSAALMIAAFSTTVRRLNGDIAWVGLYPSVLSDQRLIEHQASMLL